MHRIRNYFLTGLIIAAPIFITAAITWTFIQWIDGLVKPLIPQFYRWPFVIPGFGVAVAIAFITLLGFLTSGVSFPTAHSETSLASCPQARPHHICL